LQSLRTRRVDFVRTPLICLEQGGGVVAASSLKAEQILAQLSRHLFLVRDTVQTRQNEIRKTFGSDR